MNTPGCSEYAKPAGIPVVLIGLLGYSAILASLRGRAELTAATAYIGLAFSAYLTRGRAVPD
jgi:uncharacterized membrane protein